MLLSSLLFCLLQSQNHQVTATFVSPDDQPLAGLHVIVSLPESEGMLVTDKQGRITFATWSDRVWFSIADSGRKHKPYPLPDPQKLDGERVALTIVVDPAKIPGGNQP